MENIDPCCRGEEISTRYTTPQLGSYQRIQDIQKTWHFVCQCPRCLDPTEFGNNLTLRQKCPTFCLSVHNKTYLDKMFTKGSMMSAVKCERCDSGYLLPRLPTVIGDIYSL